MCYVKHRFDDRQNYIRAETLTRANGVLVAARSRILLARAWGGGDVAAADGLRFVAPIRTIHPGPNPGTTGRSAGARSTTWSPTSSPG